MKPVAKILEKFDKNHPDFLKRTRYMHVGGGLGDVFNHLYGTPCYADLETLGKDDRAFVFVSSHNSCAWELFAWHRNADKITMVDAGILNFLYSQNPNDKKKKEELGAPVDCDHRWPIPGPVIYYPPPKDVELVEQVKRDGKYVVFALTASDHDRSIPKELGEAVARHCLSAGYKVLVTGRNYPFNDHGVKAVRRQEIRLSTVGVSDLVDQLTVPGVAKLVEGADAVFTCHSAICMLAWHAKRPTFAIYNDYAKVTYFTKKFEGYSFGAAIPGNAHTALNDYSDGMFSRFLAALQSGRLP